MPMMDYLSQSKNEKMWMSMNLCSFYLHSADKTDIKTDSILILALEIGQV